MIFFWQVFAHRRASELDRSSDPPKKTAVVRGVYNICIKIMFIFFLLALALHS